MDDERELLRGNTPTLVLAVLQESPQHGYAIARAINQRSEGKLTCKQGTLYPALHALERDGLIAGQWEHAESERPRKVYAITDDGRRELARRVETWTRFSAGVGDIIGGGTAHDPAT